MPINLKKWGLKSLGLTLFLSISLPGWSASWSYPQAQTEAVVDNYHGNLVPDPYRWLENPSSPATLSWVEAQNQLTEAYLSALPERSKILNRLEALQNYPRTGVPFKAGKRYAFWKNNGLQNQSVLYLQENLDAQPRVLLDPNTLSSDGTVAVANVHFSKDGSLMAYALSRSGSDWQEVKIRNVETGEDYPETIKDLKFSGIAWKLDKSGFYYNRYPKPGSVPEKELYLNNKVYWHRLGSDPTTDTLIFAKPELPDWAFYPVITEDGRYLLFYGSKGTQPENRLYYQDLQTSGPTVPLLDKADAHYSVIDNQGTLFYLETDLNAPRKKVIAIDLKQPETRFWKEIIPQQAEVLSFASFINHQWVTGWLHDAHYRIKIYSAEGKFDHEVPLPVLGSLSGLTGEREDHEMLFGLTSYLFPRTSYRYHLPTRKLQVLHKPEIAFDATPYTTTQVFVRSKDGTRVPVFLTHRKDLRLDGKNPLLLYGYGGFNVSLTPNFSAAELFWLEHGGIYAVVNLRGGGEYGEDWHKAGMLEKKQNVFDDFIATAEWLIQKGYTSPAKLAIQGGSNGGLLVGATLLQRPDLFGAAICQVPVLDMLRYPLFTVGHYWIGEYGNALENPEHFQFLKAYSPLHRVQKPQPHPAILITTADHDDRVVSAHAYKFTATLQAATEGKNPVLLRVETKAGHGAGKPISKYLEGQADIFAFLFRVFGMKVN